MAPIATASSSVLGDGGANGASSSHTPTATAQITSKLASIGVAAKAAANTAIAAATTAANPVTVSSKETIALEHDHAAHK